MDAEHFRRRARERFALVELAHDSTARLGPKPGWFKYTIEVDGKPTGETRVAFDPAAGDDASVVTVVEVRTREEQDRLDAIAEWWRGVFKP